MLLPNLRDVKYAIFHKLLIFMSKHEFLFGKNISCDTENEFSGLCIYFYNVVLIALFK